MSAKTQLTQQIKNNRSFIRDQRILLVLVIIILVAVVSIINPKFIRIQNISTIFQQIAVLSVLTMSMTMMLISGGIDLSIGNMMTLSAVVLATVLKSRTTLAISYLCHSGINPVLDS